MPAQENPRDLSPVIRPAAAAAAGAIADQAGVGLRFSHSQYFRLNLTLSPLTDHDDYIGPVYDMDIGATRLSFTFSF